MVVPPAPLQAKVKVLDPGLVMVTSSDPEVPLEPDHVPEAVHDVALEELQVKVVAVLSKTSVAEALNVTEGAGVEESPPPPPPPPPQATKNDNKNKTDLFLNITHYLRVKEKKQFLI